VPDVEVAAGVLQVRTGAVLRSESVKIQGTAVEAMTVGVAGGEVQTVRYPLGQGRLQAVVVGMGEVIYEVNILQIGEFGEEGTRSAARSSVGVRIWSTLIEGAKTKQVTAVIAHVTNLQ